MITADRFISSSYNQCVFCYQDPSLGVLHSDHFSVIYDPFALLPGHLLITSKKHFGCFGELPLELLAEYEDIKIKTQKLILKSFGDPIRYEHGRAGHCLKKNPKNRFCYHYHEHWLPANVDIHSRLGKIFPGYVLSQDSQILSMFEKYGHYLLFENNKGVKKFYVADKGAPSHFIRTLIAEELGYPERQNWEDYKDCHLMLQGKAMVESKRNQTDAA